MSAALTGLFTGAVLAGGLGRRMGGPKALLPGLDGRPLVVGALEALRAAGAGPLVVVARDTLQARELGPALIAALPDPPTIVCDRLADRGPLAGLEAALSAATTPWSLVVACDMPALDPALLASIAARAVALDAPGRPVPMAVVPRVADGVAVHPQPLHAAWSRRARPAITAALAANRLALRDLLRGLEVAWLDLGPSPSFIDWDVPADRPSS